MSAPTEQLKSSYIRKQDPTGSAPEDAIRRRRKSATVAILGTFEELIESLLPRGHDEAVNHFKGVVREKINGLAYEGLRAAKAQPGESVSRHTADLAERHAFTDQED